MGNIPSCNNARHSLVICWYLSIIRVVVVVEVLNIAVVSILTENDKYALFIINYQI